jgi:hypothetical protein
MAYFKTAGHSLIRMALITFTAVQNHWMKVRLVCLLDNAWCGYMKVLW